LEAAVALVDREGLEALSMRRLGRELGVEAMSLYNHIPNKDALLDGMVEVLLGKLRSPGSNGDPSWEAQVRGAFRSYLELARAHPNVFPLFALRPLNTAESLRVFGLLREAGLDNVSALRAFRTLSGYTIGHALAEIRGPALEPAGEAEGGGKTPRAGADRTGDRDAEFEFGLDLILAGLRSRLEGSSS
jgi:AcrR family transcriptional regulator